MPRKRRRPNHATVVAYLALFVALGGTGAYAANEWTGANIVDGSLTGQDVFDNTLGNADITNGSLTGAKINDFSLKGADVGRTQLVNFAVQIGQVSAQSCVRKEVTGINAQGDHLLLTPDTASAEPGFNYGVEYQPSDSSAVISACNPVSGAVDDGSTRFNLLVIDAH
jgi:hypothetical protein